ncbi:hypothetical protein E2C01_046360 [Portunus trituberculatus]|uniref:Uncharacterized protein n=1 Tax=Portunus trituberculatus TaxID=210409 RepID=A0A5B7FXN9_PORTR|nr:hypothetical protein [Portunus trituberculatus]
MSQSVDAAMSRARGEKELIAGVKGEAGKWVTEREEKRTEVTGQWEKAKMVRVESTRV